MRRRWVLLSALIVFSLVFPCGRAIGQERSFTDETGRAVRITQSPRRIVSLAPSITEILFALGLADEIAGVTDFCDYPKAASKRPRIGGFINPSIEKIVSIQPDLIIGIRDGNRIETIERLTRLGFSVYIVDPAGLKGTVAGIERIGEIVGRQEAAGKIAKAMALKRERVGAMTRSLLRPRVFFQIGYLPMVTVGKGALADELIRLAGGRSISEDESMIYPPYNVEVVVKKAPEIILISSMESNRDYSNLIRMWRNWKSLPAVKNDAIHVVDSNLVDRPTPRIIEGLDVMLSLIHPELKNHKSKNGS